MGKEMINLRRALARKGLSKLATWWMVARKGKDEAVSRLLVLVV